MRLLIIGSRGNIGRRLTEAFPDCIGIDVMPGAAHDWLTIRRTDGAEAFLPLVEAFVREVDIKGRCIRVSPPEGWADAV